jgi:hypothetical protein
MKAFLIVIWIAVLTTSSAAQYTTASLGGTVKDSTGSAVPQASITVRKHYGP